MSIIRHCLNSPSKNPIALMQEIMALPEIGMHGPEHHILVGAALLTAYKNAGGEIDLPAALAEMEKRGSRYPGGSCGYWGCCGAAVSTGMFLSIVNGTTPLSQDHWGEGNLMTARSLRAIGEIGGPRCCKRNAFTAVIAAAEYAREVLGVPMELPETLRCTHSHRNAHCLGEKCPYHG